MTGEQVRRRDPAITEQSMTEEPRNVLSVSDKQEARRRLLERHRSGDVVNLDTSESYEFATRFRKSFREYLP